MEFAVPPPPRPAAYSGCEAQTMGECSLLLFDKYMIYVPLLIMSLTLISIFALIVSFRIKRKQNHRTGNSQQFMQRGIKNERNLSNKDNRFASMDEPIYDEIQLPMNHSFDMTTNYRMSNIL